MKKVNINEIECGDSVEIEKKMTFEMVKMFSQISEDYNSVHLDKEYASKSRYKKQIIHGMMATSLFNGLFGTELQGEGCVYKRQNIKFKRPIYIGDIVKAIVEVKYISIENKILGFRTGCLVKDKVVIDGESEILYHNE
tara:strand:- start:162 stop:578 length:417 start_codon:yes stop_codon:yes gene_type:complete